MRSSIAIGLLGTNEPPGEAQGDDHMTPVEVGTQLWGRPLDKGDDGQRGEIQRSLI
jgi:hypothetical protein